MDFVSDSELKFINNCELIATNAKTNNKSDAIILMPMDFSLDEIRIVINQLKIRGLNSRLYDRRRIQIFFEMQPKRSPAEVLMNKMPIVDFDKSVQFIYDEFDNLI